MQVHIHTNHWPKTFPFQNVVIEKDKKKTPLFLTKAEKQEQVGITVSVLCVLLFGAFRAYFTIPL